MAQLNEIEVEKFLKDSVDVEPTLLQEEFVRLPADMAYWNERYSKAMKEHLMGKLNVDRLYAMLQIEMRETLLAEGQKTTEALVSARIEVHPKYQEARLALVSAEAEAARLKGVLEAVRAKREMIVSLGAHLRVELQHDPIIREHMRGKRLESE